MKYKVKLFMGNNESDVDEFASYQGPPFRYLQDPDTKEDKVFDRVEDAYKMSQDLVAIRDKLIESLRLRFEVEEVSE